MNVSNLFSISLLASFAAMNLCFGDTALAATPTSASYVGRVCAGYYNVVGGKYAGIYGFVYKITDEKTTRYADLGPSRPEDLSPEKVREVLEKQGTAFSTDTIHSGQQFWFVMHSDSPHITFVATPESSSTLRMTRLINGRDVGTPPATATCFAQ